MGRGPVLENKASATKGTEAESRDVCGEDMKHPDEVLLETDGMSSCSQAFDSSQTLYYVIPGKREESAKLYRFSR